MSKPFERTCPYCKGSRGYFDSGYGGVPSEPCGLCCGTGVITDRAEWGRAMGFLSAESRAAKRRDAQQGEKA